MEAKTKEFSVKWYRTPLDRDTLARLNQRSDFKGLLQAGGFLGLLTLTGGTAVYSVGRWPWPLVILALFVHASFFHFLLNAFHELCHGTVFRTKALNTFFLRLVSFLSWHNYVWFTTSHTKHHQNTLHPPHDLEVVLPIRHTLKDYLKMEFFNPLVFLGSLKNNFRFCRGIIQGEWGQSIFPESDQENRRRLFNWARFQLIGHLTITAVSLYYGQWMIPLVTSWTRFYGEWLMFLCNSTQHVGLQDNVNDFRLNSRTFLLNPFLRFLYWNMNYHIEHHMYAGVPCYNLPKLHKLIEKDLPPSPRGLIQTWRQIAEILRRQKEDPSYKFIAQLPHPQRG